MIESFLWILMIQYFSVCIFLGESDYDDYDDTETEASTENEDT
jgi:hypothetical protein